MRIESEDKKSITTSAIIISIALHIFIVLSMFAINQWFPELIAKLGVKKMYLPEKQTPYIIADIMPPDIQTKPDKADYIGEYDSSVKEEMVANRFGRSDKVGTKSPETKQEDPKKNEDKDKTKKSDLFAIGDVYEPKSKDTSTNTQRSIEGDALPEDYYPDYRRGAHTYLNVLRYPNISYFVRLKRTFKLTFNPVPSLMAQFRINRIVQGRVDTVLGVTIDSKGQLKELFVFKTSGIAGYDNEAMRTISASAPFAAPPKQFLEDGLLRMSWTFTTYL